MEQIPSCSRSDSLENVPSFTRMELYLVLKSECFFKYSPSKSVKRLFEYILWKLNIEKGAFDFDNNVKKSLRVFVSKLFFKLKKCHRMHDRLIKIHENWLSEKFKVPTNQQVQNPTIKTATTAAGRPKKDFGTSSLRSKQRSVQSLVNYHSPEQLSFATESSLVKSGKRRTANMIKIALESSPRTLKKMKEAKNPSYSSYTPLEALALIVETSMTKEDYIKVQRGAKAKGANIYPAYNQIFDIKQTCYPENIVVSECEARIPLQSLLNHTITKLFEVQQAVVSLHLPTDVYAIDIYYKWGLDGSGGHSIYKQHFTDSPKYSDSNIILSTIVPLEMSIMSQGKKMVFWKNPSPSSTKWCRPIGFRLTKETNDSTKQEYEKTENQLQAITPTNIIFGDKTLTFNHITYCTMIDGKTCNVLTQTASTQSCNICKVTPKDINDIDRVLQRSCNSSFYKYGISILHAYLRSFEYLLHIAYKMDIKVWQARGKDAQAEVKRKKDKLTDLFYEKLSLVVDQPKQGGGNTNDGNTARKFFENPDIVSEITELDKNLIERFANILKTISSCHYINVDTFRPYCLETARICVQKYGWYKMSASVHKLLIHSSDIILALPLPVGQLSEDVLEASQKEYKNIRLMHSRKTSRIDTNTDIIHWLCINSDPLISHQRHGKKKKMKPFNKEVLNMLDIPINFDSNAEPSEEHPEDEVDLDTY